MFMTMSTIEVEALSRSFGDLRAVDGVSFSVDRGEIVGYLGPNGAGKSTTIKILIGLLAPTSGSVRVAGFDVGSHPIEVKRRIGYVPETGAVYESLTPFEHLSLVGGLHGIPEDVLAGRIEAALRRFEILDRVYEPMSTFSKGMKQKVVLSGALLNEPEVLFLDEPLSGLDVNATLVVKEILQEHVARGGTVFYSSHILDVVERLASRVIVIHRGSIVLDDRVQAVLAKSGDASLEDVFRQLTRGAGEA
jgi:ABC-2 type transport system ATP-binding protein